MVSRRRGRRAVAGSTAAAGQLHRDILELEELLSDAQAGSRSGDQELAWDCDYNLRALRSGDKPARKGRLEFDRIYLSGVTTPAAGSKYAKFGFEGTEHVMEKSTEKAIEHAKEARQTIKQIERLEEAGHKVQFIQKPAARPSPSPASTSTLTKCSRPRAKSKRSRP